MWHGRAVVKDMIPATVAWLISDDGAGRLLALPNTWRALVLLLLSLLRFRLVDLCSRIRESDGLLLPDNEERKVMLHIVNLCKCC